MSRRHRNKLPPWASLLFVILGIAVVITRQIPDPTRSSRHNSPEAHTAAAQAQSGIYKVTRVADGDTIEVQQGNDNNAPILRVRLQGIDAPELDQPWGQASRKRLERKIDGEDIILTVDGTDRYGRVIGFVSLGDQSINRWLIEEGYAWHYAKYNKSAEWARTQQQAQTERRGLWNDKNPTPPWDWRQR